LAPLKWAAIVLTGGSALIVGALAVLVYHAAAATLRSTSARALMAATVVLLPGLRVENLNNASNLQWTFMFATFWMLSWRPSRSWQKSVAILVVLLTVLSDPLAMLLFPLAALRVAVVRDIQSRLLAAAMIVGAICQWLAIRTIPDEGNRSLFAGTLSSDRIVSGYTGDLIHAILPSAGPLEDGTPSRVLAMLALCVAIALGLKTDWKQRIPVAAVVVCISIGMYLGPVVGGSEVAPRYLVAPAMLLVTALVMLCRPAPRSLSHLSVHSSPVRSFVGIASTHGATTLLALVLAIGWIVDFEATSFRTSGPTWSNQSGWAIEHCKTAPPEEAQSIKTMPAPWDVVMTCEQIDRRVP
jgi:hypothetical protein